VPQLRLKMTAVTSCCATLSSDLPGDDAEDRAHARLHRPRTTPWLRSIETRPRDKPYLQRDTLVALIDAEHLKVQSRSLPYLDVASRVQLHRDGFHTYYTPQPCHSFSPVPEQPECRDDQSPDVRFVESRKAQRWSALGTDSVARTV